MKNLYFCLLLIISASNAFSQANVYHPFPLNGGEWRANYFDQQCLGICEQRRYYTNGDTTIDSMKYKKLYADIVPEAGNSFYGEYLGALREDTVAKKVYFYCWCQPEELILFDFDLDSGEVIPDTYLHFQEDTMIVTSIDSLLVGNNYHKRFNLSSLTNYPISIIEGVGWSGGLILEPIYSLVGWEVTYNLKCLKVNGIIEYLDTSYVYPACDLPLGIEELPEESTQSFIFPNPVLLESTVYFNISSMGQYKIRVFDIEGRLVAETPPGINHIDLTSSLFYKGIYIVEISNDGGIVHFRKLMIQ